MPARLDARYLLLVCSLAFVLPLTGCSYLTDFVVVNASDHPIEVHYAIKKPDNALSPSRVPLVPGIKPISELYQEVPWRELTTSQYSFDPDKGTVVLSLMPGHALRIAQYNLSDGPASDAERAAIFFVEEIDIVGVSGKVQLRGEQAYRSFVPESKNVYALKYH